MLDIPAEAKAELKNFAVSLDQAQKYLQQRQQAFTVEPNGDNLAQLVVAMNDVFVQLLQAGTTYLGTMAQ